jgi:hypothetical protein
MRAVSAAVKLTNVAPPDDQAARNNAFGISS